MAPGRTYADACGMAHALDLIGERWALLIVRELVIGPKRYSDLLADLPGISTNVLAARLEGLEQTGVLQRRRLPPPAASSVYELTTWGGALEPIICSIGRWGAASPSHDRTAHLSVASFVLSLRTNFDKASASAVRTTVELRPSDDDVFTAEIRGQRLRVERSHADSPDAILTGTPPVLAGIVYGGLTLSAAIAAGQATLSGRAATIEAFRRCFVLPATAAGRHPD
ncbi:MAG: winged helix-turn-helix transcriptional regulator [Mycobacteriales bacterium]